MRRLLCYWSSNFVYHHISIYKKHCIPKIMHMVCTSFCLVANTLGVMQKHLHLCASAELMRNIGKMGRCPFKAKWNEAWSMWSWGSQQQHNYDVIMGAMASQITSLTIVYSTVYSGADQRKHQSSASLAFVWGLHRDRWIPRTNGQQRGKCFHLMTSSWILIIRPEDILHCNTATFSLLI